MRLTHRSVYVRKCSPLLDLSLQNCCCFCLIGPPFSAFPKLLVAERLFYIVKAWHRFSCPRTGGWVDPWTRGAKGRHRCSCPRIGGPVARGSVDPPIFTILRNHSQLFTTIHHHSQLFNVIHHQSPPFTIIHHHSPLFTITHPFYIIHHCAPKH